MRWTLGIALAAIACGQTFEVASVRRSPPPAPNARVSYGPARGGPGSRDPVRITWLNADLRNIVMTAYNMQTFQVEAPGWLENERYDITATIRDGATKEQVRAMWQSLLKDRFAMKVHHESKEFTVQELTVAKSGLKLKATELADGEPFIPVDGPPKLDGYGIPEMNGSGATVFIEVHGNTRTARMSVRGLTLPEIAVKLANLVHMTVLDKTGLSGRYDFYLIDFTPDFTGVPPPPGVVAPPPEAPGDPGSDIRSAVEKQLGLKLTKTKAKLDVIVVDHAEKVPTEN